jgi:hypothetical protein
MNIPIKKEENELVILRLPTMVRLPTRWGKTSEKIYQSLMNICHQSFSNSSKKKKKIEEKRHFLNHSVTVLPCHTKQMKTF